jgi:hypothetical protein
MTPANALTQPTHSNVTSNLFVAPLLKRIKKESADEYNEMQQAFELMGWGNLPDELKIEIYNDVRFMVQELKGMFSSCDPYVQQRRNTVHFWVSSYEDGICTLEAAIKAVKVKML